MKLNHTGLLNSYDRLFHVSEEAGIAYFEPRPSPSFLPGITGNVVFAISGKLLHNYLLPRDCPRVTYYSSAKTTIEDETKLMGNTSAGFIVIVESGWYQRIKDATLYVYEFDPEDFNVIDEAAGYYISYKQVIPTQIHIIDDCISALLGRNIELRFAPSLTAIAGAIQASTLGYSLIRMRNALK